MFLHALTSLTISGTVMAKGGAGGTVAGGGSGGGIQLCYAPSVVLNVTGTIDVSGGSGGSDPQGYYGGGGGGGILLMSTSLSTLTVGTFLVSGGPSGGSGASGGIGTIVVTSAGCDTVQTVSPTQNPVPSPTRSPSARSPSTKSPTRFFTTSSPTGSVSPSTVALYAYVASDYPDTSHCPGNPNVNYGSTACPSGYISLNDYSSVAPSPVYDVCYGGFAEAWGISYPYYASMPLPSNLVGNVLSSFAIVVWVNSGDTLLSVAFNIASPSGSYCELSVNSAYQNVTVVSGSEYKLGTAGSYDVYAVLFEVEPISLFNGAHIVLGEAVSSSGREVYWDEITDISSSGTVAPYGCGCVGTLSPQFSLTLYSS